jgi:putative transposase
MIDKNHPSLSVGAECRLLSISRSSFYYELMGETAMNLDLMVKIDKQFLETPFYGVQQMTWNLQNEGHAVNYKRIRRLMRLMPIYQKPDTSRPAKGHKTYPYLLGGLRVERSNQVWCADITYLPMRRGFLYLVAIMDWFTRKSGLAHLEHAGSRLLRRGAERGAPQVRPARDREHGVLSRHRFEWQCDVRAASSRHSPGPID